MRPKIIASDHDKKCAIEFFERIKREFIIEDSTGTGLKSIRGIIRASHTQIKLFLKVIDAMPKLYFEGQHTQASSDDPRLFYEIWLPNCRHKDHRFEDLKLITGEKKWEINYERDVLNKK